MFYPANVSEQGSEDAPTSAKKIIRVRLNLFAHIFLYIRVPIFFCHFKFKSQFNLRIHMKSKFLFKSTP